MPFEKDFIDFISLCNKYQVEYLLVGGLAVAVHGYPRFTGDMDIWMKMTEVNAAKMLQVIDDFGLSSLKITTEDLLQKDGVIQFGVRPVRIDIMNELAGISFDLAFVARREVIREDIKINFIGLHELLASKKAAGRQQDKADIEKLRKVNKLKK
jgi:hypothetical protein